MSAIRKLLILICVAVVLFAALALDVESVVSLTLIELSAVVPKVSALDRALAPSDDQPVSLLALVLFRAPPIDCSLS